MQRRTKTTKSIIKKTKSPYELANREKPNKPDILKQPQPYFRSNIKLLDLLSLELKLLISLLFMDLITLVKNRDAFTKLLKFPLTIGKFFAARSSRSTDPKIIVVLNRDTVPDVWMIIKVNILSDNLLVLARDALISIARKSFKGSLKIFSRICGFVQFAFNLMLIALFLSTNNKIRPS